MKNFAKIDNQKRRQGGFTLVELVAGIALTLTVGALALQALTNSQKDFAIDRTNIETGQKLSSVLDIISRDIRQAGEEISESQFPVVQVIPDSTRGAKLIVYRALTAPLAVCTSSGSVNGIPASSTVTSIAISVADSNFTDVYPSCRSNASAIGEWETLRTNVSTVPAAQKLPMIIHDNNGYLQNSFYKGTATGTQTNTISTTGTATTTILTDSFTTPSNKSFALGNATIYLSEKREYLICDNNLKVLINSPDSSSVSNQCAAADSETFQTVATRIEKMDISTFTRTAVAPTSATPNPVDAVSVNPTVNNTFPSGTLSWQNIQGLEIRLQARDPEGRAYSSLDSNAQDKLVVKGKFYPRNVLSAKKRT